MDKETVIKGCENWVNNHKDEDLLLTYSSVVELLDVLKEQEAMSIDAFVQWCIDSHIMGDATVRGIKYWVGKYKEIKESREVE